MSFLRTFAPASETRSRVSSSEVAVHQAAVGKASLRPHCFHKNRNTMEAKDLLQRVYDATNSGLDIITDLLTGIDDEVINRKKAFRLRPE